MPFGLCLAFTEVRTLETLQSIFHDGTVQRGALTATSRKTFQLSQRLSAAALATLYSFWQAHAGGVPFAYYNPFEPLSGHDPGSNYDSTGASTQGRYIVRFANSTWTQATDLCRTNVSGVQLTEVS